MIKYLGFTAMVFALSCLVAPARGQESQDSLSPRPDSIQQVQPAEPQAQPDSLPPVQTAEPQPQTEQAQPEAEWIQLFNGQDLTGWRVKIRGYELDDNFGSTFRVEDGVMKVSYDQYDSFDNRFGHIFYDNPYIYYRLRVEYRFTGEQCPGGESWALRNSGIMVHGQKAETMQKDQSFPVSLEVQLLGGDGENERTTANLCTPGTNVVMNGKLWTQHCTNSKSKTYHGDQWVTVEIEVHGNALIKHMVDGETVLEYSHPQLDESDPDAKRLLSQTGKMLHGGTISLQSESHPVEFRKVELLKLEE